MKLGQNPGRAKFREIPIKEKRALVYFLLSMLELYYFLGSKVADSDSGHRLEKPVDLPIQGFEPSLSLLPKAQLQCFLRFIDQ